MASRRGSLSPIHSSALEGPIEINGHFGLAIPSPSLGEQALNTDAAVNCTQI